jgi:hypothetical protein
MMKIIAASPQINREAIAEALRSLPIGKSKNDW